MKIRRTKKISIKIAAVIGTLEILSMTILFLSVNHSVSKILQNKAMENMTIFARDRAAIVEAYIHNCCDFVEAYSNTFEVRELFKNKNNPQALKKSLDFTHKYISTHKFIEGLYISEWDSNVLAHTNESYIGKKFRSESSAKLLEYEIKRRNKVFCPGVVLSPVTGNIVIPVYAPIFDENDLPVGFVGGAFFTEALAKKLDFIGETGIGYSLLVADSMKYIFNSDNNIAGKICGDKDIINAVQKIINSKNNSPTYSFYKDDKVVSLYYISELNWIFVIDDSIDDVFGSVNSARNKLVGSCIFMAILMVLICASLVDYLTLPLRVITAQVKKLRKNDFTHNDLIKSYCKREDEFGTIAEAIEDLHLTMEKQHRLFFDLLEVQSVGTLVTDAEDNEVILVNDKAMELWGIDVSKKKDLTMDDVRARFNSEEMKKILKVREMAKKSHEEVVYETYVTHDDGRKVHILGHAKAAHLSNGVMVVIFSLIDITAMKNLEESLVILSETDPLTMILNRRSGESKIRQSIVDGKAGMFCLFDVNKFKYVNDTFGHAAGDKVLIEITKCMKKSFRSSDILVRLGGDEFVAFSPEIEDESTGELVLDRFIHNIEEINIPELDGYNVSVSLGAVLVNGDETFERMYTKADSLMYDCKAKGGNVYKFYK